MAASRQESPDAFRSPNPHGQRLATRPRILLAAEPRPQPRPVSRRTRARGTPGRQKAKAAADPSRKKDLGVARAPLLSHGLLLRLASPPRPTPMILGSESNTLLARISATLSSCLVWPLRQGFGTSYFQPF